MSKEPYELSPEGRAKVDAVDGYLEEAIKDGRPIEALAATRALSEIASERSKQAARVATEGSWSWTDVGNALGTSKQAAHEKLRAKVHDEIGKGLSRLDRADGAARDKIAAKAKRKRDRLERLPSSPAIEAARTRIDEWEQDQYSKLHRGIQKGRDELTRAEELIQERLNQQEI